MRNPIDVLPSQALMVMTMSHALVPKEKLHEDFPEFWADWVRYQTDKMARFHEHIMNVTSQQIPTFVIRYEDLRTDPVETLKELFEFLFEEPDLSGTVCEARIKEIASRGSDA